MLEKVTKASPVASPKRLGTTDIGKCGMRTRGSPAGTSPTIATPYFSRPRNGTATAARIVATSAAGTPRNSLRSEERRVGKECRFGGAPHQEKKKQVEEAVDVAGARGAVEIVVVAHYVSRT